MYISDFHTKFVAKNEQNVLLGALQRLSHLESLSFLSGEGDEPMNDWILWSDTSPSAANA